MIRRKIVMQFIAGADEDNNYRYKKKTLRNIRPDLTDEQMSEFVIWFCVLTAHPLSEAVVVDERFLVLEQEEEIIELIPQEEHEGVFHEEGEDLTEKGVTTASFKASEATLETHEKMRTSLAASKKLQEQDQKAIAAPQKHSSKVARASQIEKKQPVLKASSTSLTPKQKPSKQNRKAKKSTVTTATQTEKKQPVPKGSSAPLNPKQESLKQNMKDKNAIVPTASQTEKKKSLPNEPSASHTKKQELLKQNLEDKKLPAPKGEARSKLKKQSPPLKANHEKIELEPINILLTKKAADFEQEVTETILDASQAFSVDDLIELVEKSEMGFISEKKLPLAKPNPQPELQFLTQETEPDLSRVDELSSKSLIMPVKKKRMHPPVGKRTKSAKKKKRS